MPQQFFDYDHIGTLVGCTITTILVTQYIKNLPFFKKIHTKLIVLFTAMVIVIMSDIILKHFSLHKIPLFILNSIFVALSAIGGWDTVAKEGKRSGKKFRNTGC